MKHALNEEYGKKFQLTDSLLKRLLPHEDYDRIKTIEPVFIYTNETICKQLKNPGYKHAAVSSNNLYIVNTPAKQDSDLIFILSLTQVEDIKVIFDTADFLQGNLRELSQHIRLTCKHHLAATEHLLFQAASLALLSNNNPNGNKILASTEMVSSFQTEKTSSDQQPLRNCKSLNTSPSSSLSQVELKNLKSSHKKNKTKESSQRPLPKPLQGTELLNASYTGSGLLSISSNFDRKSLHVSPSRSMENLSNPRLPESIPRLPLTKAQKKYLLSSSLNKSWNDIIKAEKSTMVASPAFSEISSINLDGSISSKLMKTQKGENKDVEVESLGSSQLTLSGTPSGERSRTMSHSSEQDAQKDSLDEYQVELFTITPGSNFFNIIEQSWIYSLTMKTSTLTDGEISASIVIHSSPSQKKVERDEAIQKFTQLKNEILLAEQDDELFLLTKELKYASENYLFIRKAVWKSSSLLRFCLVKLRSLMTSHSIVMSQRLDEFDLAIMIGDFLVSIFDDSEMFTGRNTLLNDNSGRFVRELLDVILITPKLKCLTRKEKRKAEDNEGLNDELYELIASWSDICIALLFELINAAKQMVWCCSLEIKSFDVTLLSSLLSNKDKEVKKLMDHLVLKLTSELTDEWETPPSPSTVVMLYKCLVVLHFVSSHCPTIMDYLKTFYHEEFKYYISKEDNITRIPTNYPITCLIAAFLPIVIKSIT